MRIVFMGTPEFAAPVLSALLDAGHDVAGVYSQPDRPRGRGRRTGPTPVKQFALDRGLAVHQPPSLRAADAQAELASLSPEAIVVAAYGRILPPAVLDLPPLGCLNLHPSLLPRYRGPSPVASAILSGDDSTGVTVMKLDEGMDTGPILAQTVTEIGPEEDAEALTTRLFEVGAALLADILPRWHRGELESTPQNDASATVTTRLSRDDGRIDWLRPALDIARQVRAYHPWPGSFTRWEGKALKVIQATPLSADASPAAGAGRVVELPDGGLGVGTGDGVLAVRWLQPEGGRAMDAVDFRRGRPGFTGATLGERRGD